LEIIAKFSLMKKPIPNSTKCVPRDDLDKNYFCALSHKSCECEFKLEILFMFIESSSSTMLFRGL